MEQFNSQLYAKYQNLKKRKLLEEEECMHKLDSDLRNNKLATESLIDELKSENDRLRAEISSLHDQYAECQKLLFEESQKSNQLSNEVGRLKNQLAQRIDNTGTALPLSSQSSPVVSSRGTSACSPEKMTLHASPHLSPGAVSRDDKKSSLSKKTSKPSTSQTYVQCKEAATILHGNSQIELVVVTPSASRGLSMKMDAKES